MSIFKSESSPEITNLRGRTNYVFTRTLAKIVYYVVVAFSLLTIVSSPMYLFVDGFGLQMFFLYLFSGLMLFLVAKLTYESFSVILDIGDASVANLSKTNNSKPSIDSSSFSSVVKELKRISEQNKEQSEALKKSIEGLSEKAEQTNTYLYHIYKK